MTTWAPFGGAQTIWQGVELTLNILETFIRPLPTHTSGGSYEDAAIFALLHEASGYGSHGHSSDFESGEHKMALVAVEMDS